MVPIIYSKIKTGTIIGIKTALRSARDFDLSLMVLASRLDGLPLSKMERALCGTGCDESAWVEGLLNGDSPSDRDLRSKSRRGRSPSPSKELLLKHLSFKY